MMDYDASAPALLAESVIEVRLNVKDDQDRQQNGKR